MLGNRVQRLTTSLIATVVPSRTCAIARRATLRSVHRAAQSGYDPFAMSPELTHAASRRVGTWDARAAMIVAVVDPSFEEGCPRCDVDESVLRAAPGQTAAGSIKLVVGFDTGPGSKLLAGEQKDVPALDDNWVLTTAHIAYDASDGATNFYVSLRSRTTGGGCFLVDDVSVREDTQ